MNMNLDIVNGALYSSGVLKEKENEGLGLLTKDDENSADHKRKDMYNICKSLYLKTFLEALSEIPWTMGRRRKRLLKTRLPHGDSGFMFTYNLPYDCARPVELSDKGTYVIDGDFLCTNTAGAELLYVSCGKRIPLNTVFEPVSVADYTSGNFDMVLSPGCVDEWDIPVDFTVSVRMEDLKGAPPAAMQPSEDYPEYLPPAYEPKFYEYLEMMIAAKFAVKNTEQPRLHDTLMQKAMLIKQEAIRSTKSITANKTEPSPWWSDRMGLHLDF